MLTIIGGSCQKYHFCCNKSFVATNMCLSWQNTHLSQQITKRVFCHDKSMFACCDKTFVTTKWCLSWKIFLSQNIFVMTKVLSWKAYFCCNKRHVLLRQTHVCHNKSKLVATKLLLRQKYVCHDKSCVVTSILLSRQKTCLSWQNFCLNTLQAPLSGTFLQTLPELVMPQKGHALSLYTCLLMLLVPSERSGY